MALEFVNIQIKFTIIKFNQRFVGIVNSWIVIPTKYTKLNVQRIKKIYNMLFVPSSVRIRRTGSRCTGRTSCCPPWPPERLPPPRPHRPPATWVPAISVAHYMTSPPLRTVHSNIRQRIGVFYVIRPIWKIIVILQRILREVGGGVSELYLLFQTVKTLCHSKTRP